MAARTQRLGPRLATFALSGAAVAASVTGLAAQGPALGAAPSATLPELRAALSACIRRETILHPLIAADPTPGMRLAIRFSVTRWGAIFGEPRFSFTSVGPSATRAAYQAAVAAALSRCTPARVTDELGGAIAGRPIVITFVETRGTRSA